LKKSAKNFKQKIWGKISRKKSASLRLVTLLSNGAESIQRCIFVVVYRYQGTLSVNNDRH
jgi:hypothetical protein